MAKLIITVEGGKITQTLNFLDRNLKDNRYVYENGNESGIVDDPEKIYADIPECHHITENYKELLDTVDLGERQITTIMRRLNELEKELDLYTIPAPERAQEHVITLDNSDMKKIAEIRGSLPLETDKHIEETIKKLIHNTNP